MERIRTLMSLKDRCMVLRSIRGNCSVGVEALRGSLNSVFGNQARTFGSSLLLKSLSS